MIYTTLWKLFLPGKVCLYHIQWLSNDNKLVFDSLNSCYCINFLTVEYQRQASLSNFANLRVRAQLRARFAQWRAAVQLQQEARNLQWISQVYLFKWFLCHLTILSFTAPTLVDLLYTTHILLSSDKFYLFVYILVVLLPEDSQKMFQQMERVLWQAESCTYSVFKDTAVNIVEAQGYFSAKSLEMGASVSKVDQVCLYKITCLLSNWM